MELTRIEGQHGPNAKFTNERIADFLFHQLDQYGDKLADITKCINYVFDKGGSITIAHEQDVIKGVVVMNETGMTGYIPEHILVYIAVHNSTRGEGVGRQLMENAIGNTKGDIALHVEPDNPAKHLYDKLGFTNKYLEMRYKNE